MSTATMSAPIEKYLDAVHEGLSDLPEDDVEEVLQDLASHIAELGETELEAALGTPEQFVAEFRASAGLIGSDSDRRGRIRRWFDRIDAVFDQTKQRMGRLLEPLVAPIARRRDELHTAWIWSRGLLGLSAYSWISNEWLYGNQGWLLGGALLKKLLAVAVATTASVWLAGQRGKWLRRTNTAASIAIAAMVLTAVVTYRYVPNAEDYYYETVPATEPVLLIGPNGPIQNLYAYDLEGNPVQVLLYDEYGNPIFTLPDYAYGEADTFAREGEPFVWEGYEIRFATDAYGRPIGNLFPLDRYEWTETGARAAPHPPPVVGIPEISGASGEPDVISEPTTEPPGEKAPAEQQATTTTTPGVSTTGEDATPATTTVPQLGR